MALWVEMSAAASGSPFAAKALETFPPYLVELARANASWQQLTDEGFSPGEIRAVIHLVGHEPRAPQLDAHLAGESHRGDVTAGTQQAMATAALGEHVTGAGT